MRYSIVALSLISPALALPTLSFLNGGVFGGHGLLGDFFSHGHSHGSDYADAPAYNGDSGSYGNGPSPANSGPFNYGSGSVSGDQGSTYSNASPIVSSPYSSVVDAASAGTGAPRSTGTAISGSVASNLTLAYTTTAPTSLPKTDSSAPATTSSEASASSSGQTCESPDVIGCEPASDPDATEVVPESAGVYDFIIVGGGTAGLVIANRLSENSYTSVAVIEAGDLVFDNKNVTNVDGYGLSFGTEIDWQYESAPQAYAGNKTQTLRAGKALGGTSTINGKPSITYQ
jgi:hypothetical protein